MSAPHQASSTTPGVHAWHPGIPQRPVTAGSKPHKFTGQKACSGVCSLHAVEYACRALRPRVASCGSLFDGSTVGGAGPTAVLPAVHAAQNTVRTP